MEEVGGAEATTETTSPVANLVAIQRRPVDHFHQTLTSFPNNNDKRIDYVIYYNYELKKTHRAEFGKIELVRKSFFDRLKEEGLEIQFIRMKEDDELHVYVLIHCPVPRLLQEAERLKFEMRLKNEFINPDALVRDLDLSLIRSCKRLVYKRSTAKVDDSGNVILSAPYDSTISHIFRNCDEESLAKGKQPFTSNTRSLLTHSILTNLQLKASKRRRTHFESVEQYLGEMQSKAEGISQRGLLYMLHQKYFDEAFILHESTSHRNQTRDLVKYSQLKRKSIAVTGTKALEDKLQNENDEGNQTSQTQENINQENLNQANLAYMITDKSGSPKSDPRSELQKKWASLKNIISMQPLGRIRRYFGEMQALYFAWAGLLAYTLFMPTVIGIIMFIVTVTQSAIRSSSSNSTTQTGVYGNKYLNIFADSFDNDLTPGYAFVMCLWGAIFCELWKRENARLAYEWDVEKFENDEPDLPEYTERNRRRVQRLKRKSDLVKYIWSFEYYFKVFCSYSVLLFMVCIVGMLLALVVLYRIHIKIKVFPNNEVAQVMVGDVGSTIINTICIMIMSTIYKRIAHWFTVWENYRTKTEFDDALIFKLFTFEFANSYGSFFYLAFFRNIDYEHGLFSLGAEYDDRCDNDNCMALLSVQVLVTLLIKPLPNFATKVLLPFFTNYVLNRITAKRKLKKVGVSEDIGTKTPRPQGAEELPPRKLSLQLQSDEQDPQKLLNEKLVYLFVGSEKGKPTPQPNKSNDYNQNIILLGYLLMFASCFWLGPLMVLVINVLYIRVDALRSIWIFKRPIGYKAQDIGAWFSIIRFLNVIGIITNAFIIGFTSNWSKTRLEDKLEYKLLFVIIFEHVVFAIWFGIIIVFPDVSQSVAIKMRLEAKCIKDIVTTAKLYKASGGASGHLIEDSGIVDGHEASLTETSSLNSEIKEPILKRRSKKKHPVHGEEKIKKRKDKQVNMSLDVKILPSGEIGEQTA